MILPHEDISEQDVARHYDELDRFYREVWGEHLHHGLWASGSETADTAVRQLVDMVAAEAEIGPENEVCDVGAGYGAASRQIVHEYGAHLTALTISKVQYEYARKHDPPDERLRYLLGDWLNNPFPSESFDAVLAIECASHMRDPGQFTREAARVLKPGGRFVVCAWVAPETATPKQVRHLLEPICREGRLTHLLTAREYVSLMEEAGLSIRYFLDLSHKVQHTWPLAIRRLLARSLQRPEHLRDLIGSKSLSRRYLMTMFRMWLAYRTEAIRYCLFKACNPASPVKVA